MKIDLYQKQVANVFAQNRLLKFGFLVLLLISVSHWQAIQTVMDKKQVVFIPLNASGDLWVSGSDASDQYLRQMARYISSMLGQYTASTARAQFEELLSLYSAENYAQAKTDFERLSDQIERYPTVSSRLIWVGKSPLRVDRAQQRIEIDVLRERLVNGDLTRKEKKQLLIQYDIVDGRFTVQSIQEQEVKQ